MICGRDLLNVFWLQITLSVLPGYLIAGIDKQNFADSLWSFLLATDNNASFHRRIVEKVLPDAKLVDDMDLDSIDFIDLVVKTKDFIPVKIDPEIFRTVRTMQDVVDTLYPYTQQ